MYNFGRSHSNGSGTVGVGGGSGHVSCRSSGTDSIGKIKINTNNWYFNLTRTTSTTASYYMQWKRPFCFM